MKEGEGMRRGNGMGWGKGIEDTPEKNFLATPSQCI